MNFESPVPTPHNEAKVGDIAKTVLMPGDPLRAKYIADNYLQDAVCFNQVRGMLGFTGKYKGKEISVMGSGMGMPSIGIYSFELYKYYGVENILRIGTAGGIGTVSVKDVLLANIVYSFSSYAKTQANSDDRFLEPSKELNEIIKKTAAELNEEIKNVNILSGDVFYTYEFKSYVDVPADWKIEGLEMESFALFQNAKVLGKKAACLLTISDMVDREEAMSSEDRQKALTNMFTIALESSIRM